MTFRARIFAGVAVVCLLMIHFKGVEAANPRANRIDSNWTSRLESLRPTNPSAYFELGEEIADSATDQAHRDLARQLFAIAASLDPERLGGSACLATATIETDEQAKRGLLALASLLDRDSFLSWTPEHGLTAQSDGLSVAVGSPTAISLAEVLGHYRRGQGPRALETLRRPGVTELLHQCDRLLPGGVAKFLDDCRHMRGQSRPNLRPGDLVRMLLLESALLSQERSWSADWLLTNGRPLLEVDPLRITDTLGGDASKPYFRDGAWTASGGDSR